jgi:3-oxoacyl-[acyl-carrier protein] reductase
MSRTGIGLTGFDGKVAVVTGAGRMRSIGRPIAVALARAGCDLVLTGTGRPPDRYPDDEKAAGWRDIESVADEVRSSGHKAVPVVSDVSDLTAVEALADDVMREFGRVDILVNNAGAARGEDRKPVVELDPALWRTVLDVNLTGAFLMSKVFGQEMIHGGRGGSIINISSIAGKLLGPNTAAYAASKAGLQALTACMAQEVARYGVRVNAICPGIIDTSRMDDLGRGEVWERFVHDNIPLGRPGTGEDIAYTALYLCSNEGAWVTGQAWNVDGGTVVQH